jgi:hypothetical protein
MLAVDLPRKPQIRDTGPPLTRLAPIVLQSASQVAINDTARDINDKMPYTFGGWLASAGYPYKMRFGARLPRRAPLACRNGGL